MIPRRLAGMARYAAAVLVLAVAVPPAMAQGTVVNTATVQWRGYPANGTGVQNGQAQASTPVVVVADVGLAKSVVAAGSGPGSQVTFQLTATNAGPDAAVDVRVDDPLPAPLTYVSATPSSGGVCAPVPAVGSNGTVTCTWAGATAAGAQRTVTVVAGIPLDLAVFSVTNTATVSTTSPDPTPGDNTASAAVALAATVAEIPTLAPFGVAALAAGLGALALRRLRRSPRTGG